MRKQTIYIGNLPPATSAESVAELFDDYGAENIRMVEGRGFAYLEVNDAQSEAAVEDKNGTTVEGRAVEVGYARRGAGMS